MEIIIREVKDIDYESIYELMKNELGLDVSLNVLSKQIDKMKVSGNYLINVALCNNIVVGFISAYKSMILEITDEYMRIIGLSVLPQYRRRGIGTQLMQSLVHYAHANEIAYIAVNSLPHLSEDHAFFEANDFIKKSVCFSKIIQGDNCIDSKIWK